MSMGIFDKFKKQSNAPQTTLEPSLGRMPFPAYRGRDPYIFISYAHLDSKKVFNEIKGFNECGYNVWYDEGISPGNEWTDEIANALEKCALFVVFITPNSAISINVQKEINFAIEDNKPFVAIHLEKTTLSGGMKLQISTIQAILKYMMAQEEYVYKYTTAFSRLGMHPKLKVQPASVVPAFSAPKADATKNTSEREISKIGDFLVEHGLLLDYLGSEQHITLPDEVYIVGTIGQGHKYINTIDLNKAGAIFDGAFTDCPNLLEIKIPKSVTMIQKMPFIHCPQLTLYCYREHLPKNFEENFGGKKIIYLDDVPAAPSASTSLGDGIGQQQQKDTKSAAATEDGIVFKSPELHRIVCAELGLSDDTVLTKAHCDSVTSIMVCGNAVGRKFNAYTNDGINVRIVPITGTNDTMATVGRGCLDTLEDIPLLRNLSKLTIPYQSVYDLTPLANSKIESLDLSSNMLSDLSPLSTMRFLKSLTLDYSQVESVGTLGKSRSLSHLAFMGIRQSNFDELCQAENDSLSNLFLASSRQLININRIGNLKNLNWLHISDTGVADIEPAKSLNYLTRFGIKNMEIRDFSSIKLFKSLKILTADAKQEEIITALFGGTFPFKAY